MKSKFETNVAVDIPKTKLHEPELPWKLREEDVGHLGPKDDDMKSLKSGAAPLKTRPVFLILLVISIFGMSAYLITGAITENDRMRANVDRKNSEISLMRTNLSKAVADKDAIKKGASRLQKKISDLMAQKQLFASVIESLTKKGDDTEMDRKEEAAPPAAVVIS